MTARRGWVALVGPAILVAGCGSADSEVEAGDGQVDERTEAISALLPPGSELAEGFVVAAGTRAVGPTFPSDGWSYDGVLSDRSWSVELVVDAEPVTAFSAYAAQAQELGFELGGGGVDACQVYSTLDQQMLPTDSGEPGTVYCRFTGRRMTNGQVENLYMTWSLDYVEPEWSEAELSYVRYPVGTDPVLYTDGPWVDPVQRSLPPPPPANPPDLQPGDVLSDTPYATGRLEEGSRLLTPVNERGCEGGFRSRLQLTGDPDEVFDAYEAQLHQHIEANRPTPGSDSDDWTFRAAESEFDGRRVREAHAGYFDGSDYSVVMLVGNEGEPTVIRFGMCHG